MPEALPDQARAVLSWLGARPIPWLVIFDNVASPDDIQDWMPAGSTRVLITSRFGEFGDLAETRPLDKWDIPTSVDFLLTVTGRDDRAGAQALAEKLDGLPLALDQAAAYLKGRDGINFAAYADRIHDMLKRDRDPGRKGRYPDTVYASLVISIEALSEPAQDLMCLLSWLSSDGVDERLIASTAEHRPEYVPDPLGDHFRDEFNRADLIERAQTASLIRTATDKKSGQMLITHRVVQAVTREWQSQQGKTGWDAHATGMVNAAFPFDSDQPSEWELAARLLPHAVELADHGPRQDEPGQSLSRLLNHAGLFRVARGDTDGAIALMKPMVEITAAVFTEDSEQYCSALSNLSGRYTDTGNYAEAEAGYLKVLKIQQELLGPEAPIIAFTLNNLAKVYWKQDQFSKAEPLLVRALELEELNHGPDTLDVASSLNALGALYDTWAEQPGQEHRREQSRELKEQAVETARKAVGERHPNVSQYLHNLAILFFRMGEFPHAAELELRAAAIMVSLGLKEHPYTNQRLQYLVHFWEKSGQGDRKDRLMEFLVPEIVAVEAEMMEWVQEDPDNRHFGPESFFIGREQLLEGVEDEDA